LPESHRITILLGRRTYWALVDLVPAAGHYHLIGISMQGAVQLAGIHASWNGVSAAHVVESRANLDFLDGILIFQERNPLAINLVFPSLGWAIAIPELPFPGYCTGILTLTFLILHITSLPI